MGTQNLNNYYFNRLDVKLNYSSYYDFFLASDEKDFNREVVYSNNIIGYNNGCVLPVWIDLNVTGLTSGCSTAPTLTCDSQTGTPQVILSQNSWCSATTTCECPYTGTSSGNSAYTVYNINLTGIDNGLFTGMTSAATISLYEDIPTDTTFCAQTYDKRFKMHQVTASTYTNHSTSYSDLTPPKSAHTSYIINSSADTSGYYQELNGGFYQGFWKLYGYPYEILPTRPACGWTMETFLKLRATGSSTPNSASTCFSTNKNMCVTYPVGSISGGSAVGCGQWTVPGSTTCSTTNGLDTFKFTQGTSRDLVLPNVLTIGKSYEVIFDISDYSSGSIMPALGSLTSGLELFSGDGQQRSSKILADGEDFIMRIGSGAELTISDIKVREHTTLNDIYPNNSGFFFYQGTRAENKFWKTFSGETGCTSFSGYCEETGLSGDSCSLNVSSGVTGFTAVHELDCCNDPITAHTLGPTILTGKTSRCNTSAHTLPVSAITDTWSNAFGVRITPDFKIGYRALRFTGSCVTTGTSTDCNTGGTFNCGYDIEEKYSDLICPPIIKSGTCEDTWMHVAVVYEREFCLSGCNVFNMGGTYDLLYTPSVYWYERYADDTIKRCQNEDPLIPEDAYYDLECSGVTNGYLSSTANTTYGKWLSQKELREGTLTFYVNGRRVMKVDSFEEIIPRALNTHRDLQVGVPFNMSWGGGSQGLYENMTYSGLSGTGCSKTPPYQVDPNDLGLLIEKNFAGTWMGGISQFRYYIEPLQADAVYHNFLVNKDRYSLIDCDHKKNCSSKGCNHPQVLYLREGDSLDIKTIFGENVDNVYVSTEGENVKFKAAVQNNVVSVTYKKNGEVVQLPFILRSDDSLEISILKDIPAVIDNLNATITLIGNLIK